MTSRNEQLQTESEFARQAELRSPGMVREFWDFLRGQKKLWMLPILLVLVMIAAFVMLSGTAAAPFIYTLF
jgi:Family of unknown function (DUF5989)